MGVLLIVIGILCFAGVLFLAVFVGIGYMCGDWRDAFWYALKSIGVVSLLALLFFMGFAALTSGVVLVAQ